jgi:hypothetical protein
MSNPYEPLRNKIQQAIAETCVKQNGAATSYNWTMGRIFEACGTACNVQGKLPSDLKNIITFEVQKLKDKVMSGDGWRAIRTSERYVFTGGTVEKRRTNTDGNNALPLDEQLRGAQDIADKIGKSLAKSPSAEQTERLNKRLKAVMKEVAFLKEEIAAQERAATEANKASMEQPATV